MITMLYLVPLAISISLVYNASRFEDPMDILRRGGNVFVRVMLFMIAVLIVLQLLSYKL